MAWVSEGPSSPQPGVKWSIDSGEAAEVPAVLRSDFCMFALENEVM